MWNRIKYLLSYFALVWVFFLVQRPAFMALDTANDYAVADYLSALWRGAAADAATAGYLTIVPFLLAVASVWYRHMPFRKVVMPYYVVVMLLVTLVFVGSVSLLPHMGGSPGASASVGLDTLRNAMAGVSGDHVAARVAAIVAVTALTSGLLWLVTPRQLAKINMIGQQLVATLLALPMGALLFFVTRLGVSGPAYGHVTSLFASTESRDSTENEFRFYDESRRAALMEGLYPTGDKGTQYVLNTARPNILVIFMEGFGATMVGKLGGERGVAPNLGRLAKGGVFFSRIFANSVSTDRGTVSTFSGYPALPTTSLMKEPDLCKALPNVARSLGKAGYTTDFLYGGNINAAGMKGYLRAGGFSQITSQADFSTSDRTDGKQAVPDGTAFNRLYDMLAARAASDKPWFTAFLTHSSQEPFEVPYRKFKDARFNAFAYTDHCIGEFIRRFSKTPQWKNTLVVLLPDHGTVYPEKGERFSPHYFRIPMIWTGGAVKRPQTVEKIMSQTDLAATLLAQLGLRHDDFKFSRNVLSDGYTSPFAFYTFDNGFCFLDNSGVSVYDLAARKVFFNVAPEGDSLRVQKGKAILQTLYGNVGEMKGSSK